MESVVLIVHVFLAIVLVGVVLLQRSEGGALGIGGGGGGLMTGRGSTNLLTRTTSVLAALFMLTSLGLNILATNRSQPSSILDEAQAPAASPAQPAGPAVPVAD